MASRVTNFIIDWTGSQDTVRELLIPSNFIIKPWFLRSSSKIPSWSPTQPQVVLVNFDGSKRNDGSTTLGFVIRDHKGNVVFVGAHSLSAELSILQVEAWAASEAV